MSVAVSLAIAGVGAAAYLVAWHTSAFAIRTIEIEGVSGPVADRVRSALRPLEGTTLVSFDGTEGRRLLATVPWVASARFDRAFPSTLRVDVTPERPIALLRRGRDTWLVAGTGRVLERVRSEALPPLPRIWLPATSEPIVGAVVSDRAGIEAVRALVPMDDVRLPASIRSVKVEQGEVSLVLDDGTLVLLGVPSELRLKLTVVARVLPLAGGAPVIDASAPDRVVAGTVHPNAQVEG